MAAMMRATGLVLVVLFAAVAVAHGREVSFQNQCSKPIKVNDEVVAVGATVFLNLPDSIFVKVNLAILDALNNPQCSGTFSCPPDVTALVAVTEGGALKVKVVAVGLIGGVVATVVGLVLYVVHCILL